MKQLLFILLMVPEIIALGQGVGYSFDIERNEIDQQFHVYNNIFANLSSSVNIYSDAIPGKIYYKDGKIENLDIKLGPGGGLFKKINDESEDIPLDGIQCVKIGADSLIVISQEKLDPNKTKQKEVLIGHLDDTEKYSLFIYKNGTTEKYYLKEKNDDSWIDCNIVGKQYFLKHIIAKYFYIEPIISKINEYSKSDMPQVFKMQKYYEYHLNNEEIYFTNGLIETSDTNQAMQYATIDAIQNGLWDFTFYSIDGKITMRGSFSSIFPFDREGKFEWYFQNGNLRSEGAYKNDRPKGIFKNYHENGILQSEYEILGKDGKKLFKKLYDKDGNEIKSNELQYLQVKDDVKNKDLLLTFKKNILTSVGYSDKVSAQFIYLLPQTPVKFKAKEDLEYPKKALKEGLNGSVILKIRLNKNGIIEDKSIFFASHDYFKESALDFLNNKDNFKSSAGKVNGQKIDSEFLFFVRYDIISNYILQYNGYWMNPALMNQYSLEHINPPTVPKIQWQK